ncbi:MAG: electron transfer flavoprotein subunit alpha [Flavobacteriaceae bacterium]|nr:electron transfer flavoprotein subunit alpha [Flavobacteriaceae bacterium]|tara:strand:+ start:17197 stop:17943 length:747 start_codon:yes stop_codon:yes gene_type:complete
MNILVCISIVPDTTSKIKFTQDQKKFDINGIQFIINPNDEFGLTRAIWLQQKHQANVDIVTVGLSSCEPILRKCLAIGANKAIRIDTDPLDGFAVAKELKELCSKEKYDLIIGGRESIDYNGGMVPGMLAQMLQMPFVTNCISLEVKDDFVITKREIDGGIETTSCSLPLVIAGQKGLVEETDLIIPNMRGIMQARQKPLEVIPSIKSVSKSEIHKFEELPPKKSVKLVDKDNIDQLIELLHSEAKVI